MERGLLSAPELAPFYDQVVWMYLFQDFSHDDADRAAERVAIRFGITSWPQHFFVDPYTLDVLGDSGRSLESFAAALRGVDVKRRQGGVTSEDLAARDAVAAKLEEPVPTAVARAHLQHEDLVVRFRAIERLRDEAPQAIAGAAEALLATPHDPTRFAVCKVIAETGAGPSVATVLATLVKEPTGSKNPNMLRTYSVQALARCGDRDAVEVVAPHATSGLYFNGLTRASIDCLVAIAQRDPGSRQAVAEHLCRAFPPLEPEAADRERRACEQLARHVHAALEAVTESAAGRSIEFPEDYGPDSRAALIESWTTAARRRR